MTESTTQTPQNEDDSKVLLSRLDHYLLACDDAAIAAERHVQTLGFKILQTLEANSGAVPDGQADMVNYMLEPPGNPDVVLVISQPLHKDSIVRKYIQKYGPGIHHVAFQVDDADKAFKQVRDRMGIKTTLDHVTRDPLTGLKQFYIDPSHAGFTIEIIQKKENKEGKQGVFSPEAGNVRELASSIRNDVQEPLSSPLPVEDELTDENKIPMSYSDLHPVLGSAMEGVQVGPIESVGFRVQHPQKAAKFLLDTFNFQSLDSAGGNIVKEKNQFHLGLYGPNVTDKTRIFVQQADSLAQDRMASLYFSVPDKDFQGLLRHVHKVPDNALLSKALKYKNEAPVFQIPKNYVGYDISLLSDQQTKKAEAYCAKENTPPTNSETALSHALSVILGGPLEHFANSPAFFELTRSQVSSSPYQANKDGKICQGFDSYSHAQLHSDAGRLAAVLRSYMPTTSSTKRVVLAVSCEATYAGFAMILACLKNAFSCVNICDLDIVDDLGEILNTLDPGILIIDTAVYGNANRIKDIVREAKYPVLALNEYDKIEGIPSVFLLSPPAGDGTVPLPLTAETFPLDKESSIFYTTGSSGESKPAILSFRALLLAAWRVQQFAKYTNNSVILSLTGLEDSAVVGLSILPVLLFGAAAVDVFGKKEKWDLLSSQPHLLSKVTSIATVPSILHELMENIPKYSMAPESLFLYGLSPSNSVRNQAALVFDEPVIYSVYGTTELMLVGMQDVSPTCLSPSAGHVLHDGVKVFIEPPAINKMPIVEADMTVVGNIWIQSELMMTGYANQNRNAHVNHEGWYDTEDIGYLDKKDGTLVLQGRTRKTMNIRGDEFAPPNFEKAWESVLPADILLAEELAVISDQNDSSYGESGVLFIKHQQYLSDKGYTPLSDIAQKIEASVESVDYYKDAFKADLLKFTSAVCLVEEFPRVGIRHKVDVGEVQRLYNEDIKPAFGGKGDKHRAFLSLRWNIAGKRYELLEWTHTIRTNESATHQRTLPHSTSQ